MAVISPILFGLLALILAIIWYYSRMKSPYSNFPPYYTSYFELIPHMLKRQLTRANFMSKLQEICNTYEKEGIYMSWLVEPVIVVFAPEAVKLLMNEPAATDKPTAYSLFNFAVGNSIFLSEGELWKKQKKILRPAFQHAELKLKMSTFNKHARNVVDKLWNLDNNKTTDDISHILKDSTLRAFLESLLGIEDNNSFGEGFLQTLVENIEMLLGFIPDRMFKYWFSPDFCLRFFPGARKYLRASEETNKMIEKIIEKRKEDMQETRKDPIKSEEIKQKLLGDVVIEAHLKDPKYTMDDVIHEMITLTLAGYLTTAVTCMWCLFLLGHHEEEQECLLREVETIDENILDEDLRTMVYTECVIKEALRIYSTIPIIGKRLSKDMQYGQEKFPNGAAIMIPAYVVHKNPDIYPDPNKFVPERFRQAKDYQRLYFVPFAEGMRPCLGKNYAMNQLKVMIAHIIRNFKVISLDSKDDVEVIWEMVLQPTKQLRMQFIPRDTINRSIPL